MESVEKKRRGRLPHSSPRSKVANEGPGQTPQPDLSNEAINLEIGNLKHVRE